MEAFLQLVASKSLDLAPLITHRFSLNDALKAYEAVSNKEGIGLLIQYPEVNRSLPAKDLNRLVRLNSEVRDSVSKVVCGVVGAGSFTRQVLLPSIGRTSAKLHTIISSGGVTASDLGRKFGFTQAGTDAANAISDPDNNLLLITTRPNTHASFVREGMKAGKAVFVEKPLCLTRSELDAIISDYGGCEAPFVMVGFNRRFAPLTQTLKQLLKANSEVKSFIYTINAGHIPPDHWMQDPVVGGVRLLAEGCHFIDLLRHLVGQSIESAQVSYTTPSGVDTQDTFSIQLNFTDGSIGTIHYFANGSKSFPKERLEVFCGGGVLQLDNFRTIHGYGWKGFSRQKSAGQDKGHDDELKAVVEALEQGKPAPIPFDEIVEVTDVSLALVESGKYVRT